MYEDYLQVVNQENLLPIFSNQTEKNSNKEIADACGTTKELTFHSNPQYVTHNADIQAY